eukprot:gene8054-biopygen17787
MARKSLSAQEDVFEGRFSVNALWMCHEALLPCFDSETRSTWRLVSKRACQAVEATTQCLTWDGDTNGKHGDPDMSILCQYSALRRVRVFRATRGLALSSLPHSLRALEVTFMDDPPVPGEEELSDLSVSATLSPFTALTQLEDATLYGFPDTSLAALEFCTALRSLDLSRLQDIAAMSLWSNLNDLCLDMDEGEMEDLSFLSKFPNLQILKIDTCGALWDLTALSACTNLRTLDLYWINQQTGVELTALSACSHLQELSLSGCVGVDDITPLSTCCNLRSLNLHDIMYHHLQDFSAMSTCSNLHTLKVNDCEEFQDLAGLATCSNLHTLELEDCEQLHDIKALTACCNLHTLRLYGCTQLQDITALSECFALQVVDLFGCAGIEYIPCFSHVWGQQGSACSNLHELSLSYWYYLEEISALSSCSSLQYLNLVDCEQLRDVTALSALCNLHTLELEVLESDRL